jgi:hypothetical protein
MADDVVLWLILAAGIAFIYCGCIFTGGHKKSLGPGDSAFEREIDRAA